MTSPSFAGAAIDASQSAAELLDMAEFQRLPPDEQRRQLAQWERDANAWLSHGQDRLEEEHRRPIPTVAPFSLHTLCTLPLPPIAYVVDQAVVAGSLTLLSGREKMGKSLVSIDMACSVAEGEALWGRMTTPGAVILANAEDSIRTVRDRVQVRLANRGLTDARPLYFLPISGEGVEGTAATSFRLNLSDPVSMMTLEENIRLLGASLVILDPLRELHSAKENDSDEMSPVMRPIRDIARRTGAAIVLIHHASKNGGARGSTAIAAACDAVATWEADDEVDGVVPETITGKLTIRGRDVPRTSMQLRMSPDHRFHPHEMPPEGKSPTLKGRIIAVLWRSPDTWLSPEDITAGDPALSLGSVKNTLTQMTKRKLVERMVTGATRNDPYRYRAIRHSDHDDNARQLQSVDQLSMTSGDE